MTRGSSDSASAATSSFGTTRLPLLARESNEKAMCSCMRFSVSVDTS